jgi:hypothetical protein
MNCGQSVLVMPFDFISHGRAGLIVPDPVAASETIRPIDAGAYISIRYM